MENIDIITENFGAQEEAAERLSEIFERDSRRYSRAFSEEEQVKQNWN